MARFIYAVEFEKREIVKSFGAKWNADVKMWYFAEPKTKKEEIILNEKIEKLNKLGFKVSEKDNVLQKIASKRIGADYSIIR